MAALAHLGVGLAAKRVAPEIPVGYLVLGAYALDLLWFAFCFAGIEQHPKLGYMYPTVWTHSLLRSLFEPNHPKNLPHSRRPRRVAVEEPL